MKFRSDIQGLRAIAVTLVIIHHYFPVFLPGGFFGVDIFFVISGYIITQILQQDLTKPLSMFLLDFYARRVRRILPSALLTIALVTLFSHVLLGPITGGDTARDGVFASLFVANIHFNNLAVDYFASGLTKPLLQHFWSLSIEEQFYLIWPLLFFLIARWRFGAIMAVLGISIGSFLLALIQVSSDATTAYFATYTRIWELGAGVLLALLNLRKPDLRLSVLGLLLLALYSFSIDTTQEFLGLPALTVITLTLILIITSEENRFLKSKLMIWIGDSSFVLYLTHWPILQLYRIWKGESVNSLESLMLIAVCLAISILIHHFFENPLRYSPFLVKKSAQSNVIGISFIALTVLGLSYIGGAI